ncbi:MAG: hypothetical protein H7251_19665 [Acetobacteraceae bacterium]|nr:hypothetical protein [Acetobacteraceae bacterium]
MLAPSSDTELCVLYHPIFSTLNVRMFRRSEPDGTPVVVVEMGDREAAVPLRSLQREFAIEDSSPDGRMLSLIAESLDFVPGLRIGDALPTEVLNGEASWEPADRHRRLAGNKLRMHLLSWIAPDRAARLTAETLSVALDDDAALRQIVHDAFERAAETLHLGSSAEVLSLIAALAEELAYIEALRDGLLRRVILVSGILAGLGRGQRLGVARQEALQQTTKLSVAATAAISQRFSEIDAQTSEIMAALRNPASQRAFIRSNRDSLYRSQRAWEPILLAWEAAGPVTVRELDEQGWRRITKTYHFLAPRYMAFKEWQSAFGARSSRRVSKIDTAMTW